MKSPAELRTITAYLKANTRNPDILDICDAVEQMLSERMVTVPVTRPSVVTRTVTPKRDRAAYMRSYRAKRHANGR